MLRRKRAPQVDMMFSGIFILLSQRLEAAFGSGATNKLTSLVRLLFYKPLFKFRFKQDLIFGLDLIITEFDKK